MSDSLCNAWNVLTGCVSTAWIARAPKQTSAQSKRLSEGTLLWAGHHFTRTALTRLVEQSGPAATLLHRFSLQDFDRLKLDFQHGRVSLASLTKGKALLNARNMYATNKSRSASFVSNETRPVVDFIEMKAADRMKLLRRNETRGTHKYSYTHAQTINLSTRRENS